jgi:hypothetical protein
MLRRLFPSRWARIVAWTGAAVAWGTSIITVQAATEQSNTTGLDPLPEPEPEVQEVAQTLAPVPASPEQGLVVIRYTPVPPPPPEVITRTVTVGAGGGGGGGTNAISGGGGGRPTINEVVSSGS